MHARMERVHVVPRHWVVTGHTCCMIWQKLAGVGFTAQGFDGSVDYLRTPDSADPRATFIFEVLCAAQLTRLEQLVPWRRVLDLVVAKDGVVRRMYCDARMACCRALPRSWASALGIMGWPVGGLRGLRSSRFASSGTPQLTAVGGILLSILCSPNLTFVACCCSRADASLGTPAHALRCPRTHEHAHSGHIHHIHCQVGGGVGGMLSWHIFGKRLSRLHACVVLRLGWRLRMASHTRTSVWPRRQRTPIQPRPGLLILW